MPFYDSKYLADRRNEWLDRIKTVKYRENGVLKDAIINSKSVNGTEMSILATALSTDVDVEVTELSFYDRNDQLVGRRTTSIKRLGSQHLLFKITLTMEEE